jgi:heat shock protein HslJ
MRYSIPLLSLLLIFISCDCTKDINKSVDDKALSFLNGNHIIIMIKNQDVANKGLTMDCNESTGEVFGNVGCNNYFGRFQQENKSFLFSKVSATKKFCKDSEIRKLELSLLNLLPNIKTIESAKLGIYNFYDDQLNLLLSIKELN